MDLPGWNGTRQGRLDPTIEQVLAADEYLLADYAAGAASINLFITYYHKTTGGPGIHSPEVCIPGGGWEISRWQQAQVTAGGGATPPFTVNRAVIRKDQSQQLVYYWFEQRGRRLASEYTAKLYTVWDAMTKSRTDGALVRLVTPLIPGEPESAADERLAKFLGPVVKIIPDYVPK
jgi:EpsI family protein